PFAVRIWRSLLAGVDIVKHNLGAGNDCPIRISDGALQSSGNRLRCSGAREQQYQCRTSQERRWKSVPTSVLRDHMALLWLDRQEMSSRFRGVCGVPTAWT